MTAEPIETGACFCGAIAAELSGAPVWVCFDHDAGLGNEVYLTIGFLDRPERFHPQAHAYWGMRLPWIEMADRLPRIEGYSRSRSVGMGNPRDR